MNKNTPRTPENLRIEAERFRVWSVIMTAMFLLNAFTLAVDSLFKHKSGGSIIWDAVAAAVTLLIARYDYVQSHNLRAEAAEIEAGQ